MGNINNIPAIVGNLKGNDEAMDLVNDVINRTQSIEIILLNKTRSTTLNFVIDEECPETYFRPGGNWYKNPKISQIGPNDHVSSMN